MRIADHSNEGLGQEVNSQTPDVPPLWTPEEEANRTQA